MMTFLAPFWIALLVSTGHGADLADFQRKIADRVTWPPPLVLRYDIPPPPPPSINVPAASFSRQLVIPFPSSGSSNPNGVDDQSKHVENKPNFANYGTNDDGDDYTLDSLISFSLAGSGRDAEGAEESKRQQSVSGSASKVDLLQQLLSWAPEGVEKGVYDKCNHPLHSWMCDRHRQAKPKAITFTPPTTTLPLPVEFFPDQSFDDVQVLVPETRPTVPPTTTTTPAPLKAGWSDEADPCTHPFHSWLCAKPIQKLVPPLLKEPPLPEASGLDNNLLLPPVVSTSTTTTLSPPPSTEAREILIEPEPSTTRKPSGWEGADPCTHPFHSWLCNRNVPPPRLRTTIPPRIEPQTTTVPPPPLIPEPEASNPRDDIVFLPEPSPTTTTQAPTTPISILITTMMPKSGWDEADSCSHPFHSWLCEKTARTKTTPKPPPTTTTEPPVEDVRFPDASNFTPEDVLPANERAVEAKTVPPSSGWEGADPCTHPFHSWLCNRSLPLRESVRRVSGAKRFGRQSSSSHHQQEEGEDRLVSAWEGFEPLRTPSEATAAGRVRSL